ncbi:MAG TPA: ester cyclase [Rubricoccaceae bacterium]|nr:ester cyclase [Rubricoccaceae bacterium]
METPEKALIREWFDEVWSKGNEDAVDRLFAPDGVAHGPIDQEDREMVGPKNYLPFFRQYKGAFPDMRIEVLHAIQEGDIVAARCEVTGTHTGEGLGPRTGRPVHIEGMTFVRIRDGQIVEAWNLFDFVTLQAQLAGTA